MADQQTFVEWRDEQLADPHLRLLMTALSYLRKGLPLPSDVRWSLTEEDWQFIVRDAKEYDGRTEE